MTSVAQELATYAALATALVWLVFRWSRRTQRSGSCSKCGSAPSTRSDGRIHLDVVR